MNYDHISPPNRKTGRIHSFDIPPVSTCPGATNTCKEKCYAINITNAYKGAGLKYVRNFDFSKKDYFSSYMVDNIPPGIFRIHCSRDFYSKEYVRNWILIAKLRPDVIFYAYTRSWKVRSIANTLLEFASLPNVILNLSVDKDTGKPTKRWEHLKWCYLTHDDKVNAWLRSTDLVFRSKHNGHKRRRKNAEKKGLPMPELVHNLGKNNVPVCPLERGTDLNLTCSKCKICFKRENANKTKEIGA